MDVRRILASWALLIPYLAGGLAMNSAAAEEKRLYIYNWTDFIGPQTIA